jgi:hypothetical protein
VSLRRPISVRLLRSALCACLIGLGLVVAVPAAPASACSCALGSIADSAAGGEVIFRGTVAEKSAPDEGLITYTFAVDEIFRGPAESTAQVRSASSGSACGMEHVSEGDDLLVFTYLVKGQEGLFSSLCSGNQAANDSALRQVERVTGPGRSPDPGGVRIDADEDAQPFIPYWSMALIGAGGVVLLMLVRRIVRRR